MNEEPQFTNEQSDDKLKKNKLKLMDDELDKVNSLKETEVHFDLSLRVYAVTYNMHGKMPNKEMLKELIPLDRNIDIYIISSQECMRSIFASCFCPSKVDWESALHEHFDAKYEELGKETLGAIHIIVFARDDILSSFHHTRTDYVKNGFLNLFGNKGAVCVYFKYKNKNFAALSCHMASGHEKNQDRNTDFARIVNVLGLKGRNEVQETNGVEGVDFCFLLGDLNYRINLEKEEIAKLLEADEIPTLLKSDQLTAEIEANRLNLNGFQEGEITFPPSYKYVEGTDNYDNTDRTPGWTDRIMYKAKSDEVKVIEYGDLKLKMSDHKPVYGIFECVCFK